MCGGPDWFYGGMPYDEELATRLRAVLAERGAFTEKKMFGALCFFLDRKMVFAANQTGDLMVRVDPAKYDEYTAQGAEQAMMGQDRPMGPGWLLAPGTSIEDDSGLRFWTGIAFDFHATLT